MKETKTRNYIVAMLKRHILFDLHEYKKAHNEMFAIEIFVIVIRIVFDLIGTFDSAVFMYIWCPKYRQSQTVLCSKW